MRRCDVVVVGGGIAGLAAAVRLVEAGRTIILLEARPRLGGRIHSVLDSATGHAVELGAEFIQGTPRTFLDILEHAGVPLQAVFERHERARGGDRHEFPDVEVLVQRLLASAGPEERDAPVASLLRRHASRFTSRELKAMTGYLEGFHAADLERFGSRALAENQAAEEADQGRLFRVAGGMAQVVSQLASRLDCERAEIRTEAAVTQIRWSPGAVEVDFRAPDGSIGQVAAPRTILTVPLTSLKADPDEAGAVPLNPNPPDWERALGRLEMGAAHRIVLRFDEAWWMKPQRPAPVFLHGENEPFPVWWTSTPSQLPFITGWAGGRRARLLSGKTIDQLVPMALRSVSSIFGSPAETIAARLRAAYSYDWTADPYARGAYSYGGIGAAEAREILQRPVADTIFLAGEALVGEGRNATVPGALTSGFRAAAAVLHRDGHGSQPEE